MINDFHKQLVKLQKAQQRASLKVKEYGQKIHEHLGTQEFVCSGCGNNVTIGESVFIKKMNYSKGYGYEESSWYENPGQGDCLCGKCGTHLNLPYNHHLISQKEYFGNVAEMYPAEWYYTKRTFITYEGGKYSGKELKFDTARELYEYFWKVKKGYCVIV